MMIRTYGKANASFLTNVFRWTNLLTKENMFSVLVAEDLYQKMTCDQSITKKEYHVVIVTEYLQILTKKDLHKDKNR